MYDISEAELPNNLAFGNLFRYRVLGQFNFCINYILPSQPPAYPLSKMLLENSGPLWVGCSPPLSQYTSYKPTIFWQVWMKERGANRNLRYSGILISLKKDIFIIKGTQPRKTQGTPINSGDNMYVPISKVTSSPFMISNVFKIQILFEPVDAKKSNN